MSSITVSFLWHMHQPFYKDLVRGSYVMPWAYLHGTKDYFGMPALLQEFPDVHQTFNLVPSLILQLEEYAKGNAIDTSMDLAFRPIDELTDADRRFIIDRFFPVPVRTMLEPFPRYYELHQRRSLSPSHLDFSDQDIRDIQAWWSLVWIDEDLRPRDLVEKGKDFSEDDKARLRGMVLKILSDIVPIYRRMQQQGSIEISTTPFYHPILPLLVHSRVDDPNVPIDFRVPEDAREQLQRARDFMAERFGAKPQGLWPSEGSVSNDVAALASAVGFRWMATDEALLAKSGVDLNGDGRHRLFKPWKRDSITMFFRDRGLSDLIGFHYMNGSASDGAGDLVRRLRDMPRGSHVSIILDGENPWDYYPRSGRDFLRHLFEGIRREPALEAVTFTEACERHPTEKLDWLAPGSWANANFSIWMGHEEDHQAWRWIMAARTALMENAGKVRQQDWKLAQEELLIAEGSDWMWWFGNDFSSDSDAIFDSLFRQHIGNIYYLLGLPRPEGLDVPIKRSLEGRSMVMAPPPR